MQSTGSLYSRPAARQFRSYGVGSLKGRGLTSQNTAIWRRRYAPLSLIPGNTARGATSKISIRMRSGSAQGTRAAQRHLPTRRCVQRCLACWRPGSPYSTNPAARQVNNCRCNSVRRNAPHRCGRRAHGSGTFPHRAAAGLWPTRPPLPARHRWLRR